MTVKLIAEALQIQAETGLPYGDAMEVAIQRAKVASINRQSATQHTILTIEEVAEEIAAILLGEPSGDDVSLIRYASTVDKIKQRLKLALQAGKIRPRSKTDGGFDNSLDFMGARAPISLNDAIAFLKSEGVALDTITHSGAKEENESTEAKGKTANWVETARSIAMEYIERHRESDLFPSQPDVCDYVAKILRGKKIYGPQSKPLSAAYIQRNAIQGEWWKANKP